MLPNLRRKGCGIYLMNNIFTSNNELEHVKLYDITILIYGYTPSNYVELESQYSDDELYAQIVQDIKD